MIPAYRWRDFQSEQKELDAGFVLFSSLASAASPMRGLRAKSSDTPRIDYVSGSLMSHAIRGAVCDLVGKPTAGLQAGGLVLDANEW